MVIPAVVSTDKRFNIVADWHRYRPLPCCCAAHILQGESELKKLCTAHILQSMLELRNFVQTIYYKVIKYRKKVCT